MTDTDALDFYKVEGDVGGQPLNRWQADTPHYTFMVIELDDEFGIFYRRNDDQALFTGPRGSENLEEATVACSKLLGELTG